MTAILAIDMMFHIIIIAEPRVTWGDGEYFQDNLQKIYECGSHGLIGFAGSIYTAKQILVHLNKMRKCSVRPVNHWGIVEDISKWSKDAFKSIPDWRKEKQDVELLYAAIDTTKPIFISENLKSYENILIGMKSPDFIPIRERDFVKIGMAKFLDGKLISNLKEDLFNMVLKKRGTSFQLMIFNQVLREEIIKLGMNTVGELFQVGIIDSNGVGFLSYKQNENNEIRVENNQFIQYSNGRVIPVKTIFEMNTVRPEKGDLVIKIKK